MARWSPTNIMVTQKGQELLSKLQVGNGKLTITRVVTGSGRVDPSSLFTQTEVSSEKQEMSVLKVSTMSTGSNIELQVTNNNVTVGYSLNQIGVYASHPDMGEILYMIAQCDSGTADSVPEPSITPVVLNYMFYLIHDNMESINITVDPAGLVTMAEFNSHLKEFQGLCDFVGYNDDEVFGVEIDYENHTYTRLGASVGLVPKDFDNFAPWGGRKRCNVTDDGVVTAYYDEDGYTETGSLTKSITKNGVTYPLGTHVQVMVEQPKFWYKMVPVKTEISTEANKSTALCKARYYISTKLRPGFKVFPLFTRGIPLEEADVAYLPAYRGSIFDTSPETHEKYKITVTSGVQQGGSGNITLVFNDRNVVINVDGRVTTTEVATAIKNAFHYSNTDWICTIDDNVVYLTYESFGALESSLQFEDTSNTGVTATVELVQEGAGGYIKNDTQVADFTENTGDLFCSIAGVTPASGSTQPLTRSNISILCKNRNIDPATGESRFKTGFGWQQKDLAANMCTAWLHLIEYNTLDCQSTIGMGISSVQGFTYDLINGDTAIFGNASSPYNSRPNFSVSYRGEENIWGYYSYFVEGINVRRSDGDIYISTTGIYSDEGTYVTEGYTPTEFTLSPIIRTHYISRVGYSEHFDWGFLPVECYGASNYPVHDAFNGCGFDYSEGNYVVERYNYISGQYQNGLCSLGTLHPESQNSSSRGGFVMFIPD